MWYYELRPQETEYYKLYKGSIYFADIVMDHIILNMGCFNCVHPKYILLLLLF